MAANGLPSGLAKVPSLNARPSMVLHPCIQMVKPIAAFRVVFQFAAGSLRERILALRLAPIRHRLAEHFDQHEQAAAALLQRAADGLEQVDDDREHGRILCSRGVRCDSLLGWRYA